MPPQETPPTTDTLPRLMQEIQGGDWVLKPDGETEDQERVRIEHPGNVHQITAETYWYNCCRRDGRCSQISRLAKAIILCGFSGVAVISTIAVSSPIRSEDVRNASMLHKLGKFTN